MVLVQDVACQALPPNTKTYSPRKHYQTNSPGIFSGKDYRIIFGNRKGSTKKLCDKDSAERSGELSGAICLKTLVLLAIAKSATGATLSRNRSL